MAGCEEHWEKAQFFLIMTGIIVTGMLNWDIFGRRLLTVRPLFRFLNSGEATTVLAQGVIGFPVNMREEMDIDSS